MGRLSKDKEFGEDTVFNLKRTDTGLTIICRASSEHLDRVAQLLRELIGPKTTEETVLETVMVVHEALTNAMGHGQARNLHILADVQSEKLVLELASDGCPWDWRKQDWSLPQGPATRGRGLYLIHTYSDTIAFNDPGTALRITKTLPPPDKA